MTIRRAAFSLLSLLLMTLSLTSAQAALSAPQAIPFEKVPIQINDPPLFRGKIVAISQSQPAYQLQIHVEQVFCDPDHLIKGHTLSTEMINDFYHGLAPIPPLQVGQEGLWAFRTQADSNPPQIQLVNKNGYFLSPSRRGVDPDYSMNLALAHEVSRMLKIPANARVPALLADGSSSNPQIARWAMDTLGQETVPVIQQKLEECLTENKLSLIGQVTVDRDAISFNWPGWSASQARLAVLQRWVSSSLTSDNADWIADELGNYSGAVTPAEQTVLMQTLATNPSLSSRDQQAFINGGYIPKFQQWAASPLSPEDASTVLAEIIDPAVSLTPDVQATLLQTLAANARIAEAQKTAVEGAYFSLLHTWASSPTMKDADVVQAEITKSTNGLTPAQQVSLLQTLAANPGVSPYRQKEIQTAESHLKL